MKKHFMIDIETFSLKNHACVISLGAVWFDPNVQGKIKEKFYVTIDPISSQKAGFRIDAETVMWWMQPAQRTAWDLWTHVAHFDPYLALYGFSEWLDACDTAERPDYPTDEPARQVYEPRDDRVIWGNGAGFDNVLLRQQYEVIDMTLPWRFYNDRCFRTMKRLPRAKEVAPPFVGFQHKADDDAEHQARWLQNIVKEYQLVV